MNSLTLWGTVIQQPTFLDTDPEKPPRVEFFVSTPSRRPQRPMKFLVTTIAKLAEKARMLRVGDDVLISGKLEPNFTRDGKSQGLMLLMNGLEKFVEEETDAAK